MLTVNKTDLLRHHEPRGFSDRLALAIVKVMRATADAIFGRRYGHRTVVLETIAAVPGMVAATLLHLKCLRRMIDDRGWIRTLMEEADNQRTHLMVFVSLAEPRLPERLLILFAQGVFYNLYFLLYLISPRTAHRLVGYFAEDSVAGYTQYLDEIEAGRIDNIPAPPVALDYWNLSDDALLSHAIVAIREDEAIHRDINHAFADALASGKDLPDLPSGRE
jgi:ubiquinol oxidase